MREPGALADQRLVTRRAQLVAAAGGAAVLPDQGAVDRLAAVGVPGDDGLALVGDPDRVQLGPLDPGGGDRLGRDPPRHLPDLVRVVLDPPGLGKVLLELGVGAAGDASLAVEDEAGGPRRPLVDREDQWRLACWWRLSPDGAGADQGGGQFTAVGERHPDADEGEDADGGAPRRPAGGAEVAALAAAVDVIAAQVEDDPFQVAVAVERESGSAAVRTVP